MKSAILIVSYAKDLPFFGPCARSISKFARGFDYVKVVVPTGDVNAFRAVAEPNGITVSGFDEEPGKGFLSHLRMKCYADHHFPDADFIFHMDSDCVFASESQPKDWLPGNKPILPFQDFSEFLTAPVEQHEMVNFMGWNGRKIDLNRGVYFWKFASEYALGFEVIRETMRWMPIVHRREVYGRTREHIERRFKQSFDQFVFSCRNEFPQTFCEFNTLGAIAHKFFDHKYCWWDVRAHYFPFVKVIQCWSRGGIDLPYEYVPEVGGLQTPRQLFERLGIA